MMRETVHKPLACRAVLSDPELNGLNAIRNVPYRINYRHHLGAVVFFSAVSVRKWVDEDEESLAIVRSNSLPICGCCSAIQLGGSQANVLAALVMGAATASAQSGLQNSPQA